MSKELEQVVVSNLETTTAHGAIPEGAQKIASGFDKALKAIDKKAGRHEPD